MDTDCHGIAHQFEDAFGVLRVTSRATRDAIRHAMHADTEPGPEPRVRVLDRRRRAALAVGAGELRLEDGTTLTIENRLPADVPFGYHDFLPRGAQEPIRLIVSPGQCPAPPDRIWGWAAQLYAVRSQTSWGMGDMADLRVLAGWARQLGAGFVLVNPLPAVDPVVPQEPSPYYPTSRRFRNPLYIHIEDVPGAQQLGDDLARLAKAGRALSQTSRIERDKVFVAKQQALEKIWQSFRGAPAFDDFRRQWGAPLRQFATFCTLVEKLGADWSRWPAEYACPEAPAVARFETENLRRVEYHEWLQWLMDVQLAAANRTLPIVQDMPIGIATRGADAWTWQNVLADGVAVGAPPDMYNTQGQNWGIPPWAPRLLKQARYEPFIQTIRALLRHAGGLRIDHVMGLFRLFWIPRGKPPVEGTYVEYPAEDLLNIVALESHRSGAFVVGEDLGTVGKNVRRMLADARILSNRLLWFESHPPSEYPRLALAAVTTHDLPTIAGLWTGSDLAAQEALDLRPNVEATTAIRDRLREMTGLSETASAPDVVRATYRLLAGAPSRIVTATLEDALAVEKRPNMPATIDEWPNWRIPLPQPLETLLESPLARDIAAALSGRSSTKAASPKPATANQADVTGHQVTPVIGPSEQ
ncbi:MAG TPA: 4-alpha-glucanotransferase [Pirellulales bacterium]|nr:4-alpha-glucanotransferase [Pirellulales bacterium]